jgi:hypothetical protein
LVDAYQARAVDAAASLRMLADSPVAAMIVKYQQSGVESLTTEEKLRFSMFHRNNANRLDASNFAYQQGLLPERESGLESAIRVMGPIWRDLGIQVPRESFRAEVERILAIVDKEAAAETA